VLQNRRGLPIALVLIYKYVAEGVGLTVQGINAPGHFMAAVECPEPSPNDDQPANPWIFVDPFYGGDLLDRDDVRKRIAETTGRDISGAAERLVPATHPEWLLRMLRNLQAVFAQTGRERDLYAMQEIQDLLLARS
jgi:regulator of sirC expression with transglutaminase-like and TPR domain